MDDAALERALGLVARQLAPTGSFYANVRTPDGSGRSPGSEHWEEFPVVTRSLGFYREAGAHHGLELQDLGPLSALGHRSGDPVQDAQRMLRWRPAPAGP
jgi:hypothetical protein